MTPERRLAIVRAVWPWLLVLGVIAVVTLVTAQIYQVRIGVLGHELERLCKLAIHPNRRRRARSSSGARRARCSSSPAPASSAARVPPPPAARGGDGVLAGRARS